MYKLKKKGLESANSKLGESILLVSRAAFLLTGILYVFGVLFFLKKKKKKKKKKKGSQKLVFNIKSR
jgi:predicted membrane channel-forming protein YqfA (hemolysin III family)